MKWKAGLLPQYQPRGLRPKSPQRFNHREESHGSGFRLRAPQSDEEASWERIRRGSLTGSGQVPTQNGAWTTLGLPRFFPRGKVALGRPPPPATSLSRSCPQASMASTERKTTQTPPLTLFPEISTLHTRIRPLATEVRKKTKPDVIEHLQGWQVAPWQMAPWNLRPSWFSLPTQSACLDHPGSARPSSAFPKFSTILQVWVRSNEHRSRQPSFLLCNAPITRTAYPIGLLLLLLNQPSRPRRQKTCLGCACFTYRDLSH